MRGVAATILRVRRFADGFVAMECPDCKEPTEDEGGSAGLVRRFCPECGWQEWSVVDPALPDLGPIPDYAYAIEWASTNGPTTFEVGALRRVLPSLGTVPLTALLRQVAGRSGWDLGDGRGVNLEEARAACKREGLRLVRREKA